MSMPKKSKRGIYIFQLADFFDLAINRFLAFNMGFPYKTAVRKITVRYNKENY